jgi:hypothetical protein
MDFLLFALWLVGFCVTFEWLTDALPPETDRLTTVISVMLCLIAALAWPIVWLWAWYFGQRFGGI